MHHSRITLGISCIVALALLAAGCGGGGDGGTGPAPAGTLDNVTLAATAGAPGGRIEIQGLPEAKSYGGYEVVVLGPDGAELFRLPVEDPDGGLPWILAPFHPSAPLDGGSISLRVVRGEDQQSPTLSLDLGTLPPAPGAFAQYVASLRAHIDQRAVREGSSFDALAGQDIGDVEARLLPLKFAQVFVDDPGHTDSLARIADGGSGYLGAAQRDLLDRIFGHANIDSLVQADIAHMSDPQPSSLEWYGTDADAGKSCVNMGPTVSTAAQLSEAMQEAFASKVAVDPGGAPGQILSATGLALGAAALVPATAPVAAVAGAALYAYQTAREYKANTYPSEFVSLDFQLTTDTMPEDEPGFASWYDVYVIAKSNGWVADKAVFDAVMQLVGAGLGAAQKARIQDSDFLRDAALTDIGMSAGFYLDGQPSGLIEFCSQQWRVDITDLPYSEGRAVIGRVSTSDFREIRPLEVGQDVISVRAVPSLFGYRSVSAQRSIETKAIQVVATPDVVYVDTPGEEVNITAEIRYADNENLDWTTERGSWNDGRGDATNGPGTRPLLTPTNELEYPFLVTVESLSRQGLRADNTPPRLDTVLVRLRDATVTVTPGYACVANGESRQFSAVVDGLENTAVTWSVEPAVAGGPVLGSVDAAGNYTAPASGSGTVFVVATSVENPDVKGSAEVDAGVCSCHWTLTIDGDGSWQGDWATHGYASEFFVFTLTFDAADYGGTSVVLTGGPEAGQTGDWPATFTFLSGNRAWSAADGTEGTSATLAVFEHGEQMVAELSGVCVTVINEQEVYRNFRLTSRSANVSSEEFICGEQ